MNKFTVVYDKQEFGLDTYVVEAWDAFFAVGKAFKIHPPDSAVFQAYCAESAACGVHMLKPNPNFDWELYRKRKKQLEWEREHENRTGAESNDHADRSSGSQAKHDDDLIDRQYALKLFGLSEGYTESDLKRAYSQLIRKNHPDKVAALDDDFRLLAEKKAKRINFAREVLQQTKDGNHH